MYVLVLLDQWSNFLILISNVFSSFLSFTSIFCEVSSWKFWFDHAIEFYFCHCVI
jgi:hypothetical protein